MADLFDDRPAQAEPIPDARLEDIPSLRGSQWRYALGSDGANVAIRVLTFETSSFDPSAFSSAGILCPPRIARSVHKRQAEFFFGRLAARQALAAVAANLASASIGIGDAREPVWPAGVIGSITHDRRFAAAAVATDMRRHGIGIDIERIIDPVTSTSLRDMIVDAQEMQNLLSQARAWPPDVLVTLSFSAKESLFKAAYRSVGQIFGFDAVRVVALDTERGRLRLQLARTLCKDFVEGQTCEIGFEFLDSDTVITHFVW